MWNVLAAAEGVIVYISGSHVQFRSFETDLGLEKSRSREKAMARMAKRR